MNTNAKILQKAYPTNTNNERDSLQTYRYTNEDNYI